MPSDPSLPADRFRGLDRLHELLRNVRLGVTPHRLVERVAREHEVPIADLLEGTVGPGGDRDPALEHVVWTRVARTLGREDARWGALRVDPDDLPTRREVHRSVEIAEKLPTGIERDEDEVVYRAYGRGLIEGSSRAYARQHHRIEQLDQLARADALRGRRNAAELEDLLEVARRDEEAAEKQGVDAYALAVAWRSRLEDAADGLAEERLEERAVKLGRGSDQLSSAGDALAAARRQLRAAAADTGLHARAAERASRQPLRLSRVARSLGHPTSRGTTDEGDRTPAPAR